MKTKFEVNDWVEDKNTGNFGKVTRVLLNPYVPDWLNWLIKPNYLVDIFDIHENVSNTRIEVYKQSELKWRQP